MGEYAGSARERSSSGTILNGMFAEGFMSTGSMDPGADPLILGPRASQALRGTSSPTSHPFESSSRYRNGSYNSSNNLLRDAMVTSSPPETPGNMVTGGGVGGGGAGGDVFVTNGGRLNSSWNKVKAFNPTWSTGE